MYKKQWLDEVEYDPKSNIMEFEEGVDWLR